MTEDWSDKRREFERMCERHRAELERALAELQHKRQEFEAKMAALRMEMATAQQEFERALARGRGQMEAAREYRDRFGAWPKKRRRPPRGFESGEPVPVKPRPKPTPLQDGAEAPIE